MDYKEDIENLFGLDLVCHENIEWADTSKEKLTNEIKTLKLKLKTLEEQIKLQNERIIELLEKSARSEEVFRRKQLSHYIREKKKLWEIIFAYHTNQMNTLS